jgi:large subunit ribosomal protein L36e
MSGIAVGSSKGHIVTKRNVAPSASALQKGKRTKSGETCRAVMAEVAGYSPYERRIIELLRIGKDKRALKFAKKRLGTHLRAKRKRDQLTEALRAKRS